MGEGEERGVGECQMGVQGLFLRDKDFTTSWRRVTSARSWSTSELSCGEEFLTAVTDGAATSTTLSAS